jgi:hypothetical protein
MITGKDLEGWLTAENPQKAMATAILQKEHRDRRERIATAALAGLLSQSQYWSPHQAASEAIEHADTLIAELDKKEEDKT